MKISRFVKSICYLCLTAVLLAVSTSVQLSMRREGGLESAYFMSNTYLFITAIVLLGTAVYSYRSYTRRHREHVRDSLFLLVMGLATMVAALVGWVGFGGLGEDFAETGYTAANLNVIVMTLLPLPPLIRAFLLAYSRENRRRRVSLIACTIVAAVYAVIIAAGGMLRMVYYEEPTYDYFEPFSESGGTLDA